MKAAIKLFLAGFLLICFASGAFAQNNNRRGTVSAQNKYFVDILDFYHGSPDSTLVNIFIQVPYNEVKFFKTADGFTANYVVTISVFDNDREKLIAEKLWSEKIISHNFDQTTSKTNYNISLRSFVLKPAKYFIRTSVEDKNSNNSYVISNPVEVREFSPRMDISDIMLIASETKIDGNNKIVPNVSRNIVAKKSGIPMFYEINTLSKGKFLINYIISNKAERRVSSDTVKTDLAAGRNQVFYTIKDSTLNLGTYTLTVKAENLDTKEDAKVSSKFISRWSGVPQNVTDLDKAIEELIYIATDKELDYIKDAPNREEKIKRFAEFWRKRDPNPNDEENQAFDEYYRRVAYSNDHFTHYIEGWKTDMGMVYIVLGPPDNIEHHPFDPDSKPYEIWDYYNLNRSFGFLDTTGFGDYRLMNPLDFDYVRGRVN